MKKKQGQCRSIFKQRKQIVLRYRRFHLKKERVFPRLLYHFKYCVWHQMYILPEEYHLNRQWTMNHLTNCTLFCSDEALRNNANKRIDGTILKDGQGTGGCSSHCHYTHTSLPDDLPGQPIFGWYGILRKSQRLMLGNNPRIVKMAF